MGSIDSGNEQLKLLLSATSKVIGIIHVVMKTKEDDDNGVNSLNVFRPRHE